MWLVRVRAPAALWITVQAKPVRSECHSEVVGERGELGCNAAEQRVGTRAELRACAPAVQATQPRAIGPPLVAEADLDVHRVGFRQREEAAEAKDAERHVHLELDCESTGSGEYIGS